MTHSIRDVHFYATWLPWCALGGVIYDGRLELGYRLCCVR